jgi:hypothetical protein
VLARLEGLDRLAHRHAQLHDQVVLAAGGVQEAREVAFDPVLREGVRDTQDEPTGRALERFRLAEPGGVRARVERLADAGADVLPGRGGGGIGRHRKARV